MTNPLPEKKCVHCIKFCSKDRCKFNCDCPCNAAPHSSDIEEIVREFQKEHIGGHGPMANGHHDVQEAESWVEATPECLIDWLRTTLESFEAKIRKEGEINIAALIESAKEVGYRKGIVENFIAMDKQMIDDIATAKYGDPLFDLIKDIKEAALTEERTRLHAAIEGEKKEGFHLIELATSPVREIILEGRTWNSALTRIQDLLSPNK